MVIQSSPPPFKKPNLVLTSLMMLVLIVVSAASLGTYTIESGKVGTLSTFGRYSEDVKEPGLHFKIPFIQEVRVMDVKMQTAHYQPISNRQTGQGVIWNPRIVVLDSTNLNIGMDVTLQFTPDSTQAKRILEEYGVNYFDKLIGPIVRDSIRAVVSLHQAEDIAKERSKIGTDLNRFLSEKFEPLPFILNEVQLRHIDLPEIVRKKIEEVQLAKQEEQRLAMIEKQAEKQQKIKTIEAKTRMIEVTTKARADAEKEKIQADANAYQIRVNADAISKANREIALSLTSELIRYEGIRKWDGIYPLTLVGNSQGTLLQLPSVGEKTR